MLSSRFSSDFDLFLSVEDFLQMAISSSLMFLKSSGSTANGRALFVAGGDSVEPSFEPSAFR